MWLAATTPGGMSFNIWTSSRRALHAANFLRLLAFDFPDKKFLQLCVVKSAQVSLDLT
jgi:hypothetical protein